MNAAAVPPVLRAGAWMLVTISSFVLMAVTVRFLSVRMQAYEIVFFRSLVGLLILLPIVLRAGLGAMVTRRLPLHLARNAVHFTGQFAWTYAIPLLPLAQVFALEFTIPMWVGLLAWFFLGERLTGPRLAALGVGFIGVLVLVRPGLSGFAPESLIVLFAALAFAGSIVFVKTLTATERPLTIVFYMNLIQLLLALLPSLFSWVTPRPEELPWLVLAGISGLGAHYALTRALRLAEAVVVMPLEFLRVPAIAAVGYWLFHEVLELWTLVGAIIILLANYYLIRYEVKRREG